MSSAYAISWSPERKGEAVIDLQSPLHFGVGFTAGALGLDPHLALIGFVGAKIVEESLSAGPRHAIFGRERGQSLGNELADILFEIAGLYYGKLLRTRLAERAAQQVPAAPPAAVQGIDDWCRYNPGYCDPTRNIP